MLKNGIGTGYSLLRDNGNVLVTGDSHVFKAMMFLYESPEVSFSQRKDSYSHHSQLTRGLPNYIYIAWQVR